MLSCLRFVLVPLLSLGLVFAQKHVSVADCTFSADPDEFLSRAARAIGSSDLNGRFTAEPGWVRDRDVRAEDIEATIYSALGIDWTTLRKDNRFGRGFEYVPSADQDLYGPVHELWN